MCGLLGAMFLVSYNPKFFERLNAFEHALLPSRVSEKEGTVIELGMKNHAAHNPLSRFAFSSIFNSAMNMNSWNAPLSVLPSEEEEKKIYLTLLLDPE